ncbi:MAG: hypothetical protein U0667_14265 [Chloroflexota bacterium]
MYTVSIGASRGRTAITAVETLARADDRDDIRVVTFADRLPPDANPADVYGAITDLSRAVREQNGGAEPFVVLLYGGGDTAAYELLLDDYRRRARDRRPFAITSAAAGGGNRAAYVSRVDLASVLFREFRTGRLVFTSGMPAIDRLRDQMDGFQVVETASGNLRFGDESMDVYDDQVVSLMLAVHRRNWGHGPRRAVGSDGEVWESEAAMRAVTGSAGRLPNAVTKATSIETIRSERVR